MRNTKWDKKRFMEEMNKSELSFEVYMTLEDDTFLKYVDEIITPRITVLLQGKHGFAEKMIATIAFSTLHLIFDRYNLSDSDLEDIFMEESVEDALILASADKFLTIPEYVGKCTKEEMELIKKLAIFNLTADK